MCTPHPHGILLIGKAATRLLRFVLDSRGLTSARCQQVLPIPTVAKLICTSAKSTSSHHNTTSLADIL